MPLAATSGGALKQFIEGLGLSVSAYRDWAPEGAPLPQVVITEDLNFVFDGKESQDAEAPYRTGVEMVQIDVYSAWRDSTGALVENYTIAPSIMRALHGARLSQSPTLSYGVIVVGMIRSLDIDQEYQVMTNGVVTATYSGIVQTSITANIYRQA